MELRGSDRRLVAQQLGREPITEFSVVARCPDSHPLVVRNHPVDRYGNPFPTLYWLSCPAAVKAVSTLEAEGWIKRLAERAERDPEWGGSLAAAHDDHAVDRARGHGPARTWGGVAGARGGIKCLHAHYANHIAGGPDPVGAWVSQRIEPIHRDATPRTRVAAVDMGTNSIRLLVVEDRDGDAVEIARDLVITRLGTGIDRTGRLHPEALGRTVAVLERYARRARALGVERVRVGATSAVRDAEDRRLLEAEVRRCVGAPPEVLDGTREAELAFLGATASLDAPSPFLVFDIGGGSTELVLGARHPFTAVSVDVGSVRVTERVGPADPPTEGDLLRMHEEVRSALEAAERSIPLGRAVTLVGVAGTTTTVQALSLGLERYDPEAIHLTVLRRDEAERVAGELAAMTIEERRALPVMTPGREDVIVAGCVILLEIFGRWRFASCLVSERDILDGLALEMLRRDA